MPRSGAVAMPEPPLQIVNGMNLDPQRFYKRLLFLCKLTCLMPLYSATPWKNRLHFAYMVLVWSWTVLHLLTQIGDLIVSYNNITRVAQNLAFSICIVNNISRALTIVSKWDSIHRIILGTNAFFRRESDNIRGEKANIHNWEKIASLWFQFYGIGGVCAMNLFVFSPLVVRLYSGPPPPGPNSTYDPLPAKAWYPFDETTTAGFTVAYLLQAPPVLMGAAMLVAGDSFCIRVVALTCGQLHLLRHEIRCIRESAAATARDRATNRQTLQILLDGTDEAREEPTEEEIKVEMDRELRRHAVRHGKILNFISDVERALSPVAFANSRVLTVCLVTTAFEIMNSKELTIPRLVAIGVYLYTAIGFVLIYCLVGDLLINEQEKIHGELYETPWLEASLSYKKTICFMGDRSRIPMKISVGKIATLNLEFYVSEMNRAFSVFNAMLQLRKIEQRNGS